MAFWVELGLGDSNCDLELFDPAVASSKGAYMGYVRVLHGIGHFGCTLNPKP